MAEFDTSIYRNPQGAFIPKIEDQVDRQLKLAHLLQYKQAAGKHELEQQQIRTKLQREGELAGIYQEAAGDQSKLVSLLGRRGFFPEMQAIQKEGIASQKTQAESGKLQMETLLKKMQVSRDALVGVNGDADMPAYKAMVEQIWGPEVAAKTPERFDPNWKNSVLMTAEQHFQALQKQMDRDVTTRGQNMTADTARTGQGVTMRGQDLTAATAQRGQDIGAATAMSGQGRPQWDADRGVWVTPPQGSAPGGFVAPQGASAPGAVPQSALPPRQKDIPANINTAIIENDTALGKVEDAIRLAKANPSAFGLQNFAGDTLMQRLDPKGVEARAMVADLGSLKIHDRSGAAVTAAEFPRLRPFIPSANDAPDVVLKKLEQFRKEYESIQSSMREVYSPQQGYRNNPVLQRRFRPGEKFGTLDAARQSAVATAYEDPANHERLRQAGFIR